MSKKDKGSGLFGSGNNEDLIEIAERLMGREKKEKVGCLTIVIVLLIALISLPITFLWISFVFMTLWNWFLPAIGFATITHSTSMGIVLMAQLFRIGLTEKEVSTEDMKEAPISTMVYHIIGYWFASGFLLLIGWMALLFA